MEINKLLFRMHKGIKIVAIEMSDFLFSEIKTFFILDENDKEFIKFNMYEYKIEILFDGYEVNDLSNHPMGIWKTNNYNC